MSADTLFVAVNAAVLPAWLLLLVAPRWPGTARVAGGVAPALLAVVYIVLIVTGHGQGDFLSLEGVRRLFEAPMFLLAGWVHYLAFDVFVGTWEVQDAHRRGVPHGLVVPCLLLTLMFGPAGLLLYFGVRRFTGPRSL
jgi:ABA4-like protein